MPVAPELAELARRIEADADGLADRRAVVLPDLYVDHFVPLPDTPRFHEAVDEIARRGGGNHVARGQFYRVGGNATNTAYALGRLGVPTTLITRTGALGRSLLERAVEGLPVRLERVRDVGTSSTTVALEFGDTGANVMLSDPGPLADFGPDDLEDADWSAIEGADVVALTNWSQSLVGGTDLLAAVVPRARRAGALTFLDAGDPTHRGEAIGALVGSGALRDDLTVWAMNESEVVRFARFAGGEEDADLQDAVRALASRFHGRLDVHTSEGATSHTAGKRIGSAGSFRLEPRHRTGAGDAWNAGCLFGELLGLSDTERLTVANAVGGLTLSCEGSLPPDVPTLAAFLERAEPRPYAP